MGFAIIYPFVRNHTILFIWCSLSVGDAFGERSFFPPNVENLIAHRALPGPPWRYTDDTEMAQIAAQCGFYDQSHFNRHFKSATGLTPLVYRRRFRERRDHTD